MHRHIRTSRSVPTLLLLLASACGSTQSFGPNRDALAAAQKDIDAGRSRRAVQALEELLVETSPEANDYLLQRFYASYLLTRAHMAGAMQAPWLRERAGGSRTLSASSGRGMEPSPTGHLVALTAWAGYAMEWSGKAGGFDGEARKEQLPEPLATMTVDHAYAYSVLALMTTGSRLGFERHVDEFIAENTELQKLETCEPLLAQVGVLDAMRPWIYLGIFRYLMEIDEPEAFKFAIRARETNPTTEGFGTIDRVAMDAIADWIETGSSYQFECPDDPDTYFRRSRSNCHECARPYLEFRAVRKTAD